MRFYSALCFSASLLIIAGCSSTPAAHDTGSIHARTFSFVNRGTRPTPNFADNREAVHVMIQESITRSLAGRGIARVPSGGDLTVGYLIIVGNNATTEMISDYFGYGENADALHEKAQSAYTKSKNPNYFEAGTLVIDIIDAKSYKLLKRGHATRPIVPNLTDDARSARIQEAVEEILRDVRVTM